MLHEMVRDLDVAPMVVVLPDVASFDPPAIRIVGGEGQAALLEALDAHVLAHSIDFRYGLWVLQ